MRYLFLVITSLWATCLFSQTSFFVSPNGNDGNQGTLVKPYATIKKAQVEARKIAGSVVIYLLGGNYHLNEPIIFLPEDSRKANETLTLKNFENQQVTISGGSVLHLKWKEYKNGIWQAHINAATAFDALIVNGQWQRMARYPNYDATAHFLGGTSADAVSKERAARWKSPEGGYIHALHPSEWGDVHYIITGKDDQGELMLKGGWQNNRRMGMHSKYRFVENIFEELDTVNEWFFDKTSQTLYYYPPKDLDITTAKFETPQIARLFDFRGSEAAPVSNISIEGLTLTETLRTFMENKEPLLRSDWTIYRGGAVFYEGAVNCSLKNCTLVHLGGNALFFSNFNRKCGVSGCRMAEIGASAICFVGDPSAVRSPSFEYNDFVPLAQMDRNPGPKTNNYPAECTVFDNLMYNLGQAEIQSAGVELSMCQSIIVSHNTIYDVPRAGINVSEGTWGGHIIEYNDVFNTVKESGDHGSFNSWGRDRYWHPDKKILDSIVATNFDLALLDVVKPITLRNNRMRCDHGWDIDLDDGSSNYRIYNNLCLNGGIKLREGVNRVVENNIIINNSFHPHVWFRNSNDIFRRNIVSTAYLPVGITVWGNEVDYNVFPDSVSMKASQRNGTDLHSVCGALVFMHPQDGDFRPKEGSVAFSVGFRNFAMDSFGVISPVLKALAKKVPLPAVITPGKMNDSDMVDFMGARIKNLNTPGERSATGMGETRGVLVVEVASETAASGFLQANDVILSFNNIKTGTLRELLEARRLVKGTNAEVVIFRNQKEIKKRIELGDRK